MSMRFQAAALILSAGLLAVVLPADPAHACGSSLFKPRTCVAGQCDSELVVPRSTQDAVAKGLLRLASFNIRIFSNGSRDDGELAKIVAILELFDIIAIQELRDTRVLDRAVEVLESDTGVDWAYRASPPVGAGVKELYAFLYRTDRVASLDQGALIPNIWRTYNAGSNPDANERKAAKKETAMRGDNKPPFIREPYIATFRAGNFTFRLLTIHAIYKSKNALERAVEFRQLAAIYREVQNDGGDRDLLLLGDFNDPPDHWRFAPIANLGGMHCTTRPPQKTTLRDVSLYDSICYRAADTDENLPAPAPVADILVFEEQEPFTDLSVEDGRYKQACLAVSDHRPVFTEFSTTAEDSD